MSVQHTRPEPPARDWAWLALAVVACYANALTGGFQFDDYHVIVNNLDVQSWDAWRSATGQGRQAIRPLLKFSYLLNWTSGWGASGFHAINVAIHLANTLLVYRLSQLFLNTLAVQPGRRQIAPGTARQLPLWSALLFAVHPVHTEAVTYVCGRSASLMALFYLAGVWLYATARTRGRLYLGVPLLFALALAVKETAVTFALALLSWELVFGANPKQVWRRQWPVWLLLLAGAAYFLLSDNYLAHMQRSAKLNTLTGNLATQAFATVYLLRQWALPLWLNIDPDLALLHDLPSATPYLAALAAAVALAWMCRRKRPWIGFALAWALVHLLALHIFLPRLDVANERQLLLASWPLGLALAVELGLWLRPAALPWVLGVLVLGLGSLTALRNRDYNNEIALWEATVQRSPNKARVHNNLGYAYQLAARVDDARREYSIALRLDPADIKARYNLQRLDLP